MPNIEPHHSDEIIRQEQQAQADVQDSVPAQEVSNTYKRRSIWVSSCESLAYLSGLSRKALRQRDRVSDILLGLIIMLMIPVSLAPWQKNGLLLAVLCDFACLAMVIWFVANRLGILGTLTDKQAVLIWDIALGIFILGILFCINVALIFEFILHCQT